MALKAPSRRRIPRSTIDGVDGAVAAAFLVAALAALAPSPAAARGAEEPPQRRVERRVVVHGGEEVSGHHPFGKRGYLGIALLEATPELRRHLGAPEDAGVLVGRVEEGSPAARAGIAVGDVLARVDGEPVTSAGEAAHAVSSHAGGERLALELWRDGRRLEVEATLEERAGLPRSWHFKGRRHAGEPLVPGPGGPGGPGAFAWKLSGEGLEELEELRHLEELPEVAELLGRLRERRSDLAQQIETLEERLEALEKRLEKLDSGDR